MRNDNPRPFAPLLLLISALILAGCQQVESGKPPSANAPANNGKIAITTASEDARKEYLAGRDLQEKLRITDSIAHFDNSLLGHNPSIPLQ